MLGTTAIEHAGAARGPHREFLGAPVAMNPAEPERLDRGHHEPRIHFPETFVVQSDTVHIRRPNVVNQNVGLRNHPLENRETLGSRNVERDAEFVGVEIEKQPALLGMGASPGNGPRVRARSPIPGRSTLITSAPISAISLAVYGAETISPISTILRPANAPAI